MDNGLASFFMGLYFNESQTKIHKKIFSLLVENGITEKYPNGTVEYININNLVKVLAQHFYFRMKVSKIFTIDHPVINQFKDLFQDMGFINAMIEIEKDAVTYNILNDSTEYNLKFINGNVDLIHIVKSDDTELTAINTNIDSIITDIIDDSEIGTSKIVVSAPTPVINSDDNSNKVFLQKKDFDLPDESLDEINNNINIFIKKYIHTDIVKNDDKYGSISLFSTKDDSSNVYIRITDSTKELHTKTTLRINDVSMTMFYNKICFNIFKAKKILQFILKDFCLPQTDDVKLFNVYSINKKAMISIIDKISEELSYK